MDRKRKSTQRSKFGLDPGRIFKHVMEMDLGGIWGHLPWRKEVSTGLATAWHITGG